MGVFQKKGASVEIKQVSSNFSSLIVRKGTNTIEFPQSKDYALINSNKISLPGINVYNGEKWYLSRKALNLVQ